MTRAERIALVTRSDLLAGLCEFKHEHSLTWVGVLALQPEHTGGSTLDRKLIAQAMAGLEREEFRGRL